MCVLHTQMFNRASVLLPDCQHIVRRLTVESTNCSAGGTQLCHRRGTQDSVESCRGQDTLSVWLVLSFCCVTRANYHSGPSSQRGQKNSQERTTPPSAGCSTVCWTSKETRAFTTSQAFAGWGVGLRNAGYWSS